MEPYNWNEKHCPICGKTFFINCQEYAYKRFEKNTKYLCSYTCLLKFDREREKIIAENKRKREEARKAKCQ